MINMIKGWQHLSTRLRDLGLSACRREGLGGILSVYIEKYLWGKSKEDGARFFSLVPSGRTRGNEHTLKHKEFCLNIRKSFFYCENGWTLVQLVQKLWSLHPWSSSKPDWMQSQAICCSWPCCEWGSWTRWSPEAPPGASLTTLWLENSGFLKEFNRGFRVFHQKINIFSLKMKLLSRLVFSDMQHNIITIN